MRLAAGLALMVAGLVGTAAAATDELVRLDTRPGITVPYLLVRPSGPPTASVGLFAGGHGHLALSSSWIGWGKGNCLVRTRHRFAEHGLLVAVVERARRARAHLERDAAQPRATRIPRRLRVKDIRIPTLVVHHPGDALSAHGYLGIEDKVVAAVAGWITATRP